MTMADVAREARVSYSRVRQIKSKIGRVPTVEEVLSRKNARGRPTKEYEKSMALKFVGNPRGLRTFLECLIEKYGKNATLKEIIEKENEK